MLLIIFILSQIAMVELSANNYQAEKSCVIRKTNVLKSFLATDIFYKKSNAFKCEIKNSDFTLDVNSYIKIEKQIKEHQNIENISSVVFKWTLNKKESSLTKLFNISAFINLFRNFNIPILIQFHNLKSIELNLFDELPHSISQFFFDQLRHDI